MIIYSNLLFFNYSVEILKNYILNCLDLGFLEVSKQVLVRFRQLMHVLQCWYFAVSFYFSDHNNIGTLDSGFLSSLVELKSLDLSYNRICLLNASAFPVMPQLNNL